MPTPSALRNFPVIDREAAKIIVQKWMSGATLTPCEAEAIDTMSAQNRAEQLASIYEVRQ